MKKFYLLVVLMFGAFCCFSQSDTSKSGTTVIFLGADRTEAKTIYGSSAIKFGILDLASGLYGLHYEHEFSSIFGAQIGGGLTGRNFTQGLLQKDESNEESNNIVEGGYDILDSYYDYDTRTASLGYFVAFEPKFYFREDGFDGPFFSFLLSYRRYNYDAQNIVSSSTGTYDFTNSNPIAEFENQLITAIGYGVQSTNDRTILDFDFYVGIRNIKGDRRDLWNVPNQNGGTDTVVLINDVKKNNFFFGVSFKLGLYWNSKNKNR